MNIKWEKFAIEVAKGTPAGRAYEKAGYSARGASADSGGERLMRKDEIRAKIDEIREKTNTGEVLGIIDRKTMLSRIAKNNEDGSPKDSRGAIDLLNRMDGGYEPEKVEHQFKVVIGGNVDGEQAPRDQD